MITRGLWKRMVKAIANCRRLVSRVTRHMVLIRIHTTITANPRPLQIMPLADLMHGAPLAPPAIPVSPAPPKQSSVSCVPTRCQLCDRNRTHAGMAVCGVCYQFPGYLQKKLFDGTWSPEKTATVQAWQDAARNN